MSGIEKISIITNCREGRVEEKDVILDETDICLERHKFEKLTQEERDYLKNI